MRHSRRNALTIIGGSAASLLVGASNVYAQGSDSAFASWIETFRVRARARGISDATYDATMQGMKPDTSVYALQRRQAEFTDPLWKYLNRRLSAWRIQFGAAKMREITSLLDRIESRYGVDRFTLMGIWGNESAFGEIVTDRRYMRPVLPALAALAFGEPRRKAYWEQELLNALRIVERGWSTPKDMIGSWAGAMGHTQWMPEAWLGIGVDFNNDGRVSPFNMDDALAGSARYLIERGKYARGEPWGGEVRLPPGLAQASGEAGSKTIAQWRDLGVTASDTSLFTSLGMKTTLWVPVRGGPAFLLGRNFYAVKSYNPAMSYALSVTLLGDRIAGKPALSAAFPGSERALTLNELQDMQRLLTKLGYNTYYSNGRVGRETTEAITDFQRKQAISPADGYPGQEVLARLRKIAG